MFIRITPPRSVLVQRRVDLTLKASTSVFSFQAPIVSTRPGSSSSQTATSRPYWDIPSFYLLPCSKMSISHLFFTYVTHVSSFDKWKLSETVCCSRINVLETSNSGTSKLLCWEKFDLNGKTIDIFKLNVDQKYQKIFKQLQVISTINISISAS